MLSFMEHVEAENDYMLIEAVTAKQQTAIDMILRYNAEARGARADFVKAIKAEFKISDMGAGQWWDKYKHLAASKDYKRGALGTPEAKALAAAKQLGYNPTQSTFAAASVKPTTAAPVAAKPAAASTPAVSDEEKLKSLYTELRKKYHKDGDPDVRVWQNGSQFVQVYWSYTFRRGWEPRFDSIGRQYDQMMKRIGDEYKKKGFDVAFKSYNDSTPSYSEYEQSFGGSVTFTVSKSNVGKSTTAPAQKAKPAPAVKPKPVQTAKPAPVSAKPSAQQDKSQAEAYKLALQQEFWLDNTQWDVKIAGDTLTVKWSYELDEDERQLSIGWMRRAYDEERTEAYEVEEEIRQKLIAKDWDRSVAGDTKKTAKGFSVTWKYSRKKQ